MLRIWYGSQALKHAFIRSELPCERFLPIAAAMYSRSPCRSCQKQNLAPKGRKNPEKREERLSPLFSIVPQNLTYSLSFNLYSSWAIDYSCKTINWRLSFSLPIKSKSRRIEDIRGTNKKSQCLCGFADFLCSDSVNIYVHLAGEHIANTKFKKTVDLFSSLN